MFSAFQRHPITLRPKSKTLSMVHISHFLGLFPTHLASASHAPILSPPQDTHTPSFILPEMTFA